MQLLKLVAFDRDDLGILSAQLQDAVLRVADLAFLSKDQRFAAVINRFDWSAAPSDGNQRRRSAIRFEHVRAVQSQNIIQTAPDAVLSLLAIRFEETIAPSGVITLVFSGGGALRLNVDLEVMNAKSDPVVQSQQLLELIQSSSGPPDAVLVEPVNNQGLPRVAEAAVAAGVGWVISNARVDYLEPLRKIAKAPLFTVSQDHMEIGRMQGRQIAAFLPGGGSILYLRGPVTNFLASQRSEGMESVTPQNIHVKTLKIQWTEESAYNSVCSWLNLSTVRAADTDLISSQNTDFILAAKKLNPLLFC